MFTPDQQATIDSALSILENAMRREEFQLFQSPSIVSRYARLKIGAEQREVFAVLFLDNRHGLIAYDELFKGTINACSVYPREVVKAALRHNAAKVVLLHNHPSGVVEPSEADRAITRRLSDALAVVDIQVLDHVIVGSELSYSFAEYGLL